MTTKRFFCIITLIGLAACAGWVSPSSARQSAPEWDHTVYLPFVTGGAGSAQAIVVDHRHTDISKIPARWITAARQFTIHYAHTSHGSQVLTGLKWLEGRDARYSVNIEASGDVIHPNESGALNIYDGNNYSGDTYITPEMYWASADGVNHTRSVVDTNWFDISLWTWCGQMSSDDDATTQNYLDTLAQLQAQHPGVRFIFYTGHTDGSTQGGTLWRNNNRVRQYVQAHGGALFDFADMESYDPGGTFYPNMDGSEGCEWCTDWCAAHPAHFACQSVPDGCAHTDGLQCTLKGQAFWYLLARLAGWDGMSSK